MVRPIKMNDDWRLSFAVCMSRHMWCRDAHDHVIWLASFLMCHICFLPVYAFAFLPTSPVRHSESSRLFRACTIPTSWRRSRLEHRTTRTPSCSSEWCSRTPDRRVHARVRWECITVHLLRAIRARLNGRTVHQFMLSTAGCLSPGFCLASPLVYVCVRIGRYSARLSGPLGHTYPSKFYAR